MVYRVRELPLTYSGHVARLRLYPRIDGRWDVNAYVDGREIVCDTRLDWRRVERLRARIERWLQMAEGTKHEQSSAA